MSWQWNALIRERRQHGRVSAAIVCEWFFFRKVTAHCSQIVCAVTNRDGYGCNAQDVQENIEDTVHAGWCDKFFDGIFTDIDQSEREAVLLFNEKMVGSAGLLAPIERDLVKFQTLAGSHTNQGHRQLCTNHIG